MKTVPEDPADKALQLYGNAAAEAWLKKQEQEREAIAIQRAIAAAQANPRWGDLEKLVSDWIAKHGAKGGWYTRDEPENPLSYNAYGHKGASDITEMQCAIARALPLRIDRDKRPILSSYGEMTT